MNIWGKDFRIRRKYISVFSRNPRGGKAKALNMEDVAKLEAIMVENNFALILAHAPYTLNMAGQKEDVYDFAKMAFREDLERLESLPCHLYNFYSAIQEKA